MTYMELNGQHVVRLEFYEYWAFYEKTQSYDVLKLSVWNIRKDFAIWLSLGLVLNSDVFVSSFTQRDVSKHIDVEFAGKQDAVMFKLIWA